MRTAISPAYFDFHELAYHFLALSDADRLLRFGRVISDFEIVAYVEALYFSGDPVFVVTEPAPSIAGALHLEIPDCGGNLGLSVSDWARRQGIGALLLERAGLIAISRGISTLFVRNLSANIALRSLAHRVGMKVAWVPDTGVSRLDPPTGTRNPTHGKYIAEQVTLADHCLRFQWDDRSSVDSIPGDILEGTAASY
jgi:hypothetical protein